VANPQGNVKPAAVSLQYDKATQTYETPEQQRLRVRKDLTKNAELIQKYTGKSPRIMVWPYGAIDSVGVEEAARAGMPINFTLRDGLASTANIQAVERSLVGEELLLNKFSYLVKYGITQKYVDPVRAVTLNLDRIYDVDPAVQEQKLGRLIEQIARLGINAVVLNPFAASGSDDTLRQTYFPNSVLPMRADLLNRVAWQLRSRLTLDVYLSIPANRLVVQQDEEWLHLDDADPADRAQLLTLYSELSQHATAQGLMFDTVDSEHTERLTFNQAVVERMRYYRPHIMPIYADGSTVQSLDTPASIEKFVRSMPAPPPQLIPLPLKNTSNDEFAEVLAKVRFFQKLGVSDFLLDSDDFLDEPQRFEQVRKAFSLKDNPYL